jgi:hypothetical protein
VIHQLGRNPGILQVLLDLGGLGFIDLLFRRSGTSLRRRARPRRGKNKKGRK